MTVEEKRERIKENIAKRRELSKMLDMSWAMIAFMPDIFSGECETFSVGFDFSIDGKGYERNRVTTHNKRVENGRLCKYTLAVISRKDKGGNVIEERKVPASELPEELLPDFLQGATKHKKTNQKKG